MSKRVVAYDMRYIVSLPAVSARESRCPARRDYTPTTYHSCHSGLSVICSFNSVSAVSQNCLCVKLARFLRESCTRFGTAFQTSYWPIRTADILIESIYRREKISCLFKYLACASVQCAPGGAFSDVASHLMASKQRKTLSPAWQSSVVGGKLWRQEDPTRSEAPCICQPQNRKMRTIPHSAEIQHP